MEEYLRYMEENPNAGVIADEEDDVQYDSDGNPIPAERSKVWHFIHCPWTVEGRESMVQQLMDLDLHRLFEQSELKFLDLL